MSLKIVRSELKKSADPERAKVLQKYFKTEEGGYGEGDVFIGLTVPQVREIAKSHVDLSLSDLKKLISSEVHEERMVALMIVVLQFKAGNATKKKKLFNFYVKNLKYINNWDLIDGSAEHIIGGFLGDNAPSLIQKLADSKNLWQRRVAVMSTFYFIKKGRYDITLELAEKLLLDKEDLIQKAVGWMLREVGKRNPKKEAEFLQRFYQKMPRTMLRYAIERFPEKVRKAYLKGQVVLAGQNKRTKAIED